MISHFDYVTTLVSSNWQPSNIPCGLLRAAASSSIRLVVVVLFFSSALDGNDNDDRERKIEKNFFFGIFPRRRRIIVCLKLLRNCRIKLGEYHQEKDSNLEENLSTTRFSI